MQAGDRSHAIGRLDGERRADEERVAWFTTRVRRSGVTAPSPGGSPNACAAGATTAGCTPGQMDYRITRYRTYAVLIEQNENSKAVLKLEAVPSLKLLGSEYPEYKAELQWRLSYIFAALLLPLLAVSLNGLSFRETRYVPLFIAIMVYFIYSNLLGISKTLIKRDDLTPLVGMWWVHLLLIGTIFLIYKYPQLRHWRRRDLSQQLLSGKG